MEKLRTGSVNRVSFEHWPIFGLKYAEPMSLELIQRDVGQISDLMTLCADEVATTQRLSFTRPDVRVRMLSGDLGPAQEIELLAAQVSYPHSENRKARHPHQMLSTYDELGGIETVSSWLDVPPSQGRLLR